MEERKSKILLTAIGAGTLLVAMVGATFAYFSATYTTTTQEVTTADLNLTVTADSNTTHITNIKPTTWSDTLATNLTNTDIAKVSFKVTSTSSSAGTYSIEMLSNNLKLNTSTVLEEQGGTAVALQGGSLSDIKYNVYKLSGDASSASSYTAVSGTGATGTFDAPTTAKEIISGATITSSLNDQYVIFVYIENKDEAQNQLQGLDFDVTVTGSASQS